VNLFKSFQWFSMASLALGVVSCAPIPPVGSPENRLPEGPIADTVIRWPTGYEPRKAGFFVSNSIRIKASPEHIWEQIVEAEMWPSWYEGASDVEVQSPGGRLDSGTSFKWNTMGLHFTSEVEEFLPPYRLSWESRKWNIQGYHAWLLIPQGDEVLLVTEEPQHGVLTLAQKVFVPRKLHRLHDVWLAQIKARAEAAQQGESNDQ
jgi:hypothetical protein